MTTFTAVLNYVFAAAMPFTHIGGYVAVGLGLFVSLRRFREVKREPVIIALLAFLSYGFLRAAFSGRPDVGFAYMGGYAAHWLLPVLLGFSAGRAVSKKSLNVFFGVFAVIVFFSLLAYAGLFWQRVGSSILVEDGLLKGLRSHIALGAICLLLVHVSLNRAISRENMPRLNRSLWFAVAAYFLLALVLAGSRGYYIAAAVSLGLFAVCRLDRRTVLAGAAAAIVLAALAYTAVPNVRARVSGTRVSEQNVSERLSLYRVGMAEFRARPVFGFGPGQAVLQTEYFSILPPEQRSVQRHRHLHSQYVQMAADLGAVGLLLFIGIAAAVFKSLYDGRMATDPFTAALAAGVFWGLAGILVGESFDTLLRGPGTAMELFWLIGLARGAQKDNI